VVSITLRPRSTLDAHCTEAGWALEPVWTQWIEEESPASVGDRTPVFQSVAKHYMTELPATRLFNNLEANGVCVRVGAYVCTQM
jgi:hypothetical protein